LIQVALLAHLLREFAEVHPKVEPFHQHAEDKFERQMQIPESAS
jgi:hypothetical protein